VPFQIICIWQSSHGKRKWSVSERSDYRLFYTLTLSLASYRPIDSYCVAGNLCPSFVRRTTNSVVKLSGVTTMVQGTQCLPASVRPGHGQLSKTRRRKDRCWVEVRFNIWLFFCPNPHNTANFVWDSDRGVYRVFAKTTSERDVIYGWPIYLLSWTCYLRQGSYFYPAFVCMSVCLSVYLSFCLSVCLLATSCKKNYPSHLHENLTNLSQMYLDEEKLIKIVDVTSFWIRI